MAPPLVYQHIGLSGFTVGTVKFDSNSIEWKDRGNIVVKSFDGDQTTRAIWTVYGVKGHLYIHFKEGKFAIFDGFSKDDFSDISPFFQEEYNVAVETANVSALLITLLVILYMQPACDGGNFGDIELDDNSMVMKSAKTGKQVFDLKLTNVSQCVLPGNNKDEVEIQFHEADTGDREEDMLVQIRLRFPTVEQADVEDRDEDAEEEETNAQIFQKKIMERGMIRSVTGNVIAEFSQDQGTFVTPRGRYAIQMYSTFMRMHGAKYDYKIKYDDIDRLFMLHRPDGVSAAVVIALAKPIRQGNQKYPYLVLQTHRMEHTMQEEIQEKYDGQLDVEMTYPMCSLVAKIFKVLSQSKVFVPKNYKSDRGDQDIERIEFKRYIPNAHSGLTARRPTYEYEFSGIDRVEYAPLFAFLTSKKLPVEKPEEDSGEKSLLEQLGEDMEEEEESEDEDYEGEAASASSSDSEEDEDGGAVMVPEPEIEKPKKSKKKVREVKGGDTPTKRKASAPVDLTDDVDSTPGPKKKARKDPKKPKAAKTAYSCFME
ncbi:ssrp1, partial [Symbiodinium microadriaticum]